MAARRENGEAHAEEGGIDMERVMRELLSIVVLLGISFPAD